MKTSTILIIGLATVLIFGGAVFGYTRLTRQAQTDAMMKTETSMMQPEAETSMMTADETMVLTSDELAMAETDDRGMMKDSEQEIMVQKGLYQVYGPEVLDGVADKRQVLFFYANWCPTCQPADKSFAENMDKIPMDTAVIRVNYNDSDTDAAEKELAKKYGVTYQHTFVQIDRDGNEVTKWNGGNIDTLLKNLE